MNTLQDFKNYCATLGIFSPLVKENMHSYYVTIVTPLSDAMQDGFTQCTPITIQDHGQEKAAYELRLSKKDIDNPAITSNRFLDTETKAPTVPKHTLAIATHWGNCLVRITSEGNHGCVYTDVITGSNKGGNYYTQLDNLIMIPDSNHITIIN